MNYQYKLIVTGRSFYYEFDILQDMKRCILGTTPACKFRLDRDYLFFELEIVLQKQNEWTMTCPENYFISFGDARKLLFIKLLHGDVFTVCYENSCETAFEVRFMINFEAEMPHYDHFIDLQENPYISIGSSSDSNICLTSEFGSKTDVRILKKGQKAELHELSSGYGIYVNGRKINKKLILEDHDFISAADFSGYYKDEKLYYCNKSLHLNGVSEYTVLPEETTYPKFIRNTRIKVKQDDSIIPILDPANIPAKPDINYVTSLMPAVIMFALVVVLRGVLNTTGGTFVLFSICSMGLGVFTSIASIIDKKKKYKLDCEKRRTVYIQYMTSKKTEIEQARTLELACLRDCYYSIEQDIANIKSFSPKLFDRIPEDEDFLDVYLGIGNVNAIRKADYKMQEKLEAGDDLSSAPAKISERYKTIANAPVVIKIKEANAIGIIGYKKNLHTMLKNILIDLVSRQYFGDFNIYLIIGEEEKTKYDWIRQLPNLQSSCMQRKIVCDSESRNIIFEDLYKEFTIRSNTKTQTGYNVIFVMKEQGIKSHPISKFIKNASELNTVFLFFEQNPAMLPLYCSQIIEIQDDQHARIYYSDNRLDQTAFSYPTISDRIMKECINILTPVYCDEIRLDENLRNNITLFELLGIYSVQDIDLKKRWSFSKIYDSIAVPIGVNTRNEIVYLDLHEKYHGPHGLVAGTTGSGKSEILLTFILSAATLFHPYEISFLIIDFKGGGMVNQLKKLPHLIGAITNIEGKEINRSLKSIRAELLKRQELFAQAEVNHIDKYIKAYKEKKVKVALSHLVIIVDEFAELKAEQPDFLKELITTARIGRSLGVHLILATQKPAGQVDEQIWSNFRFKLCLKVQNQSDSNEVLHSPLASEIREPGRAYLQVGNNELFELLQSGYSGAPEKNIFSNEKTFDIIEMDFKGTRKTVYRQKLQNAGGSGTQLDAIVDHIYHFCENNMIHRLPEICLPPLAKTIVYDSVKYPCKKSTGIPVPIGIYDDPDHQIQNIAQIELATANTIIIGSSQYGKTNLLESMIRSVAESYDPSEVNMYILDFGSMVLKNFEPMAHIGGVVCPADDEKLKNLFQFLKTQIIERREKLLSAGVSSFASYKEAGLTDLPQIIVFVDNFTALKDLYLQENDELLNMTREGISAGISFVLANSQTSGLNYRYLLNFANRIMLFCNESGEYSSVFGICREKPDEVPGRCIIEIEKTLYECQTFLAFEGKREIERVKKMRDFVKMINDRCKNQNAIRIPEIPELLDESYIIDHFGNNFQEGRQILGIGYDSVSPVFAELQKNNLLALSGGERSGKTNFMKYFINTIRSYYPDTGISIFDNYQRKLQVFQNAAEYTINAEDSIRAVFELEGILKERYHAMIQGKEYNSALKLLVINNEDALSAISSDKNAISAFRNIIGRYKILNVFVLLGHVQNAAVVYGTPEIYKIIKEQRSIMFFDDLENCRIVDIPLSVLRRNKKSISKGDAFFIIGNDCIKVKTPFASK